MRLNLKISLDFILAFLLVDILCQAPLRVRADSAESRVNLSPLTLSNQHLLASQHLSFLPPDIQRLSPGNYKLLLNGSISNTMNRKPEAYLLDAETRGIDFAFAYGLSDQWQLSLLQTASWRGGGFSDQPIDEWHKFFNFPRGDRRRVPKDEFSINGETDDGKSFNISGDAFGFFAPEAALSWEEEITDAHAVGLALRTRLPGGSSGRDISGFDTALEFFFRHLSETRQFYASASAVNYQDVAESELRFTRNQALFTLGVSQKICEHFVAYVALLGGTKFIENIKQYPDYQIYLDVGGRIPVFKDYSVELLLRENPAPSDATADVAFSLGFNASF